MAREKLPCSLMETIRSCEDQLKELDGEFKELRALHDDYRKKVNDMKEAEKKCLSGLAHQKYRMKQIVEELKKCKKVATGDQSAQVGDLLKTVAAHKGDIRDMEETLPRKVSLYLKIVLGEVNVSLLNKMEKFAYKQDYEHFKFYVTCVSLVFSAMLYFFLNNRVLDAAFHFLLVWYYCTLTIREHILIANGSRIKGWWITHHFVSTACAGIILIWPISKSYFEFRDQLLVFSFYVSCIQLIQFNYQNGTLYKLRALGGGHSLHITVDGFMSWMWYRLSFVLPFLFLGYLFQLYNAITLYKISQQEYCKEWQVLVLSIIFFVLFVGNSSTVLFVIRQKLSKDGYTLTALQVRLTNKYRFNILKSERKDI